MTTANGSPTLKLRPNVKRKKIVSPDQLHLQANQRQELNERLGVTDKNLWHLTLTHPEEVKDFKLEQFL
jgi:hypothetical protein